ncbi:MAG: hypothetical protein ACRDDA_11675, partial [Aeromonas sp.]
VMEIDIREGVIEELHQLTLEGQHTILKTDTSGQMDVQTGEDSEVLSEVHRDDVTIMKTHEDNVISDQSTHAPDTEVSAEANKPLQQPTNIAKGSRESTKSSGKEQASNVSSKDLKTQKVHTERIESTLRDFASTFDVSPKPEKDSSNEPMPVNPEDEVATLGTAKKVVTIILDVDPPTLPSDGSMHLTQCEGPEDSAYTGEISHSDIKSQQRSSSGTRKPDDQKPKRGHSDKSDVKSKVSELDKDKCKDQEEMGVIPLVESILHEQGQTTLTQMKTPDVRDIDIRTRDNEESHELTVESQHTNIETDTSTQLDVHTGEESDLGSMIHQYDVISVATGISESEKAQEDMQLRQTKTPFQLKTSEVMEINITKDEKEEPQQPTFGGQHAVMHADSSTQLDVHTGEESDLGSLIHQFDVISVATGISESEKGHIKAQEDMQLRQTLTPLQLKTSEVMEINITKDEKEEPQQPTFEDQHAVIHADTSSQMDVHTGEDSVLGSLLQQHDVT